MAPRLQLQTLFETLTPHVYFQPPGNLEMEYPCIVYQRDQERASYADNAKYINKLGYSVTVIDQDPDGELREKVSALPLCSFETSFPSDDLNHDVFNLFF